LIDSLPKNGDLANFLAQPRKPNLSSAEASDAHPSNADPNDAKHSYQHFDKLFTGLE
jgi:hypothetical protein